MDDLRKELAELKLLNVRTLSLVPPDEIRQICTQDRIQLSIRRFCKNELDAARFARNIYQSYTKIFAILLSIDAENQIKEFLLRREIDARLPYRKEGLDFLDELVASRFVDMQWAFDPVILRRDQENGNHRHLQSRLVLPFLDEEFIDRGGFGRVYKVTVLWSCQDLLPQNKSRVCHNPSIGSNRTCIDYLSDHERTWRSIKRPASR